MADLLERITAEALALPLKERAQLVDDLLESIPYGEEVPIGEVWLAEIERRSKEIDDGMKTIPADEFFAKMRRKLG